VRYPPLASVLLLAACGGQGLHPGADRACRAAAADPAALRAHVEALATRFAPRDLDHPANLDRAAAFVADALRASGAAVSDQRYDVAGHGYRNVVARFGPDTPEILVVGAHYDTAGDQPGADDDASGVAGLVELARMLGADPPPLRVELVAFTLEEPPTFRTERMGSAVHARALAERGAKVRLMISLEMIGAFSDEEGSQRYPPLVGLFHPSAGSFIGVVGKWGQGGAVTDVASALRTASRLPVETLTAPAFVTGVDWSDHRSYWEHGWDAVMVTDTAFLRNARYHTAEDTPETLDYARMAEVVKGVHCAVQAAARR
jgi:hypothetical protein